MIDMRIYTNFVKPVVETQPTQLDANKLPDVNFAEMLQRAIEQDQRAAAKAEADAARREEQATTMVSSNKFADQNAAELAASRAMLARLVDLHNKQQKDQQEQQTVIRDADELTR